MGGPARTGRVDPRRVRLFALMGVAACAVALPLTVASAGQVGDRGGADMPVAARPQPGGDGKVPSAAPSRTPFLLGLGLATAAHCGLEVSSPGGVEAQTCVLTQGADTWARTYYRNATGESLDADLTLMGPGDRTVRTHCALGGDDEPETCETPRERTSGAPSAYTAVAEFAGRTGPREAAGRAGDEPLLLRAGSNSPAGTGS